MFEIALWGKQVGGSRLGSLSNSPINAVKVTAASSPGWHACPEAVQACHTA
jgi:hypothetical protein